MRYDELLVSASSRSRRVFSAEALSLPSPWLSMVPLLLLPAMALLLKGLQEREFGPPPTRARSDVPRPILDPAPLAEVLRKAASERIPMDSPPAPFLERIRLDLKEAMPFVEVLPPAEQERLARHILLASRLWYRHLPGLRVGKVKGYEDVPGVFYVEREKPYIHVSPQGLEDLRDVLAHELGHWVVWLTGRTMGREEELVAEMISQFLRNEADQTTQEAVRSVLKEAGLDEGVLRAMWQRAQELLGRESP